MIARRVLFFRFLLFLLVLPAVASQAQPAPRVLTSIKPLQLIAIAVTGDPASVDSLLDARFSPHDYQFRPSDRDRLERAQVIFWVGPAFEVFLRNPLTTLPPRVRVVALQPNPQPDEDGHIWMDPLQAIAIGRRMAEVLSEIDPAQSARWRRNAEQLAAALKREDDNLRRELSAAAPLRQYLIAHDAYRYFESRYGLQHIAALADNAEQPAGARNLLHVQQLLDEGAIGCVFREPQYEPKVLRTLLRGHQPRVVVLDPMAIDIATTPAGIVEFYRELGRAAVSCLKA
jgi:zinc transport system substrate-binding protein